MPRIRTVKPEFWSSPDTARASLIARLTYIGMWNWADDYGRGTLNLKELEGFIFPNDEVSDLVGVGTSDTSAGTSYTFRHVVQEVVDVFGLTVYEVDRRTYYEIPSWADHQRTERKAKSKYPAPEEGENVSDQWSEGTSYTFRRTAQELPTQGGGSSRKSEHRNRGTGEGNPATSDTTTPTESAEHRSTPEPESLDDLAARYADAQDHPQAFGTIDDPRCAKHKRLDQAPACWECKKAGTILKAQAEQEKQQRLQAIHDCNLCDDNGMRDTGNGLTRCDHQPHLKAIGGPY